jgi:hypothetical protein
MPRPTRSQSGLFYQDFMPGFQQSTSLHQMPCPARSYPVRCIRILRPKSLFGSSHSDLPPPESPLHDPLFFQRRTDEKTKN